MKAMVLNGISSFEENRNPLKMIDLPVPLPGEKEVLVRVSACGVCHTELDEIEGRTPPAQISGCSRPRSRWKCGKKRK